jgi:hypothetical protein
MPVVCSRSEPLGVYPLNDTRAEPAAAILEE